MAELLNVSKAYVALGGGVTPVEIYNKNDQWKRVVPISDNGNVQLNKTDVYYNISNNQLRFIGYVYALNTYYRSGIMTFKLPDGWCIDGKQGSTGNYQTTSVNDGDKTINVCGFNNGYNPISPNYSIKIRKQ